MASEERGRDMALEWLRECVAIHDDAESPDLPGVRYALALVEATPPQPDADPLRAMLPDVVKALEAAQREFLDVLASCDAERVHHDGDEFHERLGRIESALTKLRTLTPTEED